MKGSPHATSFGRKRIHIVGPSGTEGSTVIDFLLRHGVRTITAHDFAPTPEEFARQFHRTHQWLDAAERAQALQRLLTAGIDLRLRDRYLEGIERADVVVVPQSWFRHPENAPLHALKARGVPFTSMTRLFFETCPCPIVGVTGTNGKFTVATLISEMLREAERTAYLSGNDRTLVPMLYYLDQIDPDAWLVLEISNRQLTDLPYSPHVGIVTNVAPHHLDDHGTMEAYAAVKATLVRHQTQDDHAVLNLDNAYTRAMAGETPGRRWWFSVDEEVDQGADARGGTLGVVRDGRRQPVLPLRDLPLPGRAMVENALAACGAAAAAGIEVASMAAVLRRFRGLPYRLAYAGAFGGVHVYDDSLATNPSAAAAAIRSLDRPFLLIAGGYRRGAAPGDFAPMAEALAASGLCKAVLLIGRAAPVLAEAIAALPVEDRPTVVLAGTLEAAMTEAARLAVDADGLLLSPGCESFDQFADYRQRGDRFRELAEEFGPREAKLDVTE